MTRKIGMNIGETKSSENKIYNVIATIYRNTFIKRNLNREISNNYKQGASLLHAGCGSGQVDVDLQHKYNINGIDISTEALIRYSKNNPFSREVKRASIFCLPYKNSTFDGIYNLGVMSILMRMKL